jgi:S1-C subfamily serine protease
LKALSKKVTINSIIALNNEETNEIIDFMGAKVKNLKTLGEQSATGMGDIRGVLVLEVVAGSEASKFLQANDVILVYNSRKTNNLDDLLEAQKLAIGAKTEVVIFRNQKEEKVNVKLLEKRKAKCPGLPILIEK